MTAAEARALTNARRAETHLDYQMRTKVWPAIEGEAAMGGSTKVIYLRPKVLQMAGLTPLGGRIEEQVAARLRADGFTVKAVAFSDMGSPAVEVSW